MLQIKEPVEIPYETSVWHLFSNKEYFAFIVDMATKNDYGVVRVTLATITNLAVEFSSYYEDSL